VNSFLTAPPTDSKSSSTADFAHEFVGEDGVQGYGGFSLLYGSIKDVVRSVELSRSQPQSQPPAGSGRKGQGLAIISNRTSDVHSIVWLANSAGETHGLSNSHFSDTTWP